MSKNQHKGGLTGANEIIQAFHRIQKRIFKKKRNQQLHSKKEKRGNISPHPRCSTCVSYKVFHELSNKTFWRDLCDRDTAQCSCSLSIKFIRHVANRERLMIASDAIYSMSRVTGSHSAVNSKSAGRQENLLRICQLELNSRLKQQSLWNGFFVYLQMQMGEFIRLVQCVNKWQQSHRALGAPNNHSA